MSYQRSLLSGYSGKTVTLMPNGVTYYNFNAKRKFIWEAAVREADKIKPFCPSASASLASTSTPAFTATTLPIPKGKKHD
jgi:hypothetical protein